MEERTEKMDRLERKRKRAEKAEADDKGKEAAAEEEVAAEAAPPPTEEEVEEFFAILRRMRIAVKYFEKEGINSKSVADETPTVVEPPADGGAKRGLDLNAVPEAESSFI